MKKNALVGLAVVMLWLATMVGISNTAFAGIIDYSQLTVETNVAGNLPNDFVAGETFPMFDRYSWGNADNLWNTVVGGTSMQTVIWTQDGFANENVVASFLRLSSGGWNGASGSPELFLNGESLGMFGGTAVGTRYSQDYFYLDPSLVMQDKLTFSFEVSNTGGVGWNKWYKLGILNESRVIAFVDNSAIAPVPEPATMLLFGTGLMSLAVWRRKKVY